MGKSGRPPTIETIAQHAGVSIASVSRVLNGHGGRPDTVRRVRRATEELGYVANAVARSLKGGRTSQLTFAMQDIGNPVYVAMVREIQAATKPLGYRLLLHSTDAVVEDELDVVRSLADHTSDGLILSPIRITDEHLRVLADAARPTVVIGSLPEDRPAPVDSVRADSEAGAMLAVRHLMARGRRRVAFVNGPADTVPGRNRDRGYRRALAGHDLALDEELLVTTDFSVEAGREAVHRLLDRVGGPDTERGIDAIFCANDQLALGATHALHSRGLRIPGDVAVAGMDDSVLARSCWPPLTSVDLGSVARARTAVRMLLDRLAETRGGDAEPGEQPPPRTMTVSPRLRVRASTGPADTGESIDLGGTEAPA